MRIAILHQGCIPTYRRAFYEQLGRISERRYIVFHGEAEPGGPAAALPPFDFHEVRVRNRFWHFAGRTLVYQPVFREIARGDYDALVIGHEAKYISSIALALLFRARGKPVILWGFGRLFNVNKPANPVVTSAQSLMLRLATDYLAYTRRGAEYVIRAGMMENQVTVLNNTIDISQEIGASACVQSLDRVVLRSGFGLSPDSIVFLYIGRLVDAKRVDALIEAVSMLRQSELPVELLIVGGGASDRLRKMMAANRAWCGYLGEVHDIHALACIFRCSDAVVIPGYVGLAVVHAFAHGVPVITCQSNLHSPEIEYVEPGVNGMILDASTPELAAGLRRFAIDPDLRKILAAGALVSREKLDMGQMVEAFDNGVRRALERRSNAPR